METLVTQMQKKYQKVLTFRQKHDTDLPTTTRMLVWDKDLFDLCDLHEYEVPNLLLRRSQGKKGGGVNKRGGGYFEYSDSLKGKEDTLIL